MHVDTLISTSISKPKAHGKTPGPIFHETYASTKPYPAWWSETEDSRILKRTKSMGDSVLERNVCFVDAARSKSPSCAAHYIEQQLLRTINCANQANHELSSLLSGRGGSQVDLVLYLISHGTKSRQKIGILTNCRQTISQTTVIKSDICPSSQTSFR